MLIKSKESYERMIFYTMTVAGGLFAGFTVASAGVLGTAQTSNMISIIELIFGGNTHEALIRAGGLVMFITAIVLTRVIKSFCRADIRIISLLVDTAGAAALALMPEDTDPILTLYPAFFAMAFQWNSFPGAYGFSSACIFSSNNLRQMIDGAAEYICTRNTEAGRKSLFFAGTLMFFHIGVVLSAAGWALIGQLSPLLFLPVLAIAAAGIAAQKRFVRKNAMQ